MKIKALGLAITFLMLGAGARGQAYLTQSLDTYSLNTATYDTLMGNAGPFPFSNFGVDANTTLGLSLAASTNGQTTFVFPTITAGQTFTAGQGFNYAYTPLWTSQSSIGSSAGLSVGSNFHYDIGPFSGDPSILNVGLNTSANATIGGGTTLSSGSANGTANSPSQFLGVSANAYVASASAGVNVGVQLQTSISYAPTVQYGYYTWVNTTGGYSPSDVLTWHGVSSGALNYTFDNSLPAEAGAGTFFVNFAPGVQVDMPITPTTTVGLPVSGDFHVDLFGDTVVDESLPLGTIPIYTANYDTWDDDVDFTGKYYSLELTASRDCGTVVTLNACVNPNLVYTVDGGEPALGTQLNLPGGGSGGDLTGGGGTGSWSSNFPNAPLVPGACDPTTGTCYASNDPNLPTGPGTVTITGGPVGTPEPGTVPMLGVGLAALALLSARKLRA